MGNWHKQLSEAVKHQSALNLWMRYNPIFYGQFERRLRHLQQAGIVQRRQHHGEWLHQCLKRAETTPYGKKLATGTGIERWPLLEKAQVRDNPMQFVAGPRWLAVPASTSGTSGLPLKLYRSARSIAIEQACIDHLLKQKGCELKRCKLAVLRGETIKPSEDNQPPFWRGDNEGRRLTLSSNHLNRQSLIHYHDAIREFAPDCLAAYPCVLESLCQLLREEDLELHVPWVLTSSEMLSDSNRNQALKVLNCRLVDYYGQAERVAFAYSYKSQEYYFLPGYAHVELRFCAAQPDYDTYEIVGTPFWNSAMPLVRYRTGDVIKVEKNLPDSALERICLGLQPFQGIEGRTEDYLISPAGGRLSAIDHIPRDVEHIRQLQIIQHSPSRVTIKVLTSRGFDTKDRQQILINAREKLPPSMAIEVRETEQLARSPSGKTPFVIREFGDQTHRSQAN